MKAARTARRRAGLLATGLAVSLTLAACGSGGTDSGDTPIVGLITKTDTNSFFGSAASGGKSRMFSVTITSARPRTAAARTCRSFGSFVLAAINDL
jgi:hypothetical protein